MQANSREKAFEVYNRISKDPTMVTPDLVIGEYCDKTLIDRL